uniref:RNA-directed DNA polymerase, eukaryota, reverse transcriptase zinc-binding domain protein n=1 Tax=Tanacetum cinerariifolium TaxID=118510 RepID=A0A699GP99_TANCI|nr:RNA-directed DNA polymerase, eukaryota, reverse transcriptase zinc-binding domain protein [Tanacetum cinerariifolium]
MGRGRGYSDTSEKGGIKGNRNHHNTFHKGATNQWSGGVDRRFDTRDTRRYNDVVSGGAKGGTEGSGGGEDNKKKDVCRMLELSEEDVEIEDENEDEDDVKEEKGDENNPQEGSGNGNGSGLRSARQGSREPRGDENSQGCLHNSE